MIHGIWGNQQRYLQLHGCTAKQPQCVSASIPQGDPFAMMAMSLLLSVPWRDLCRRFPAACWMLYVDDRSWVAPTARMCVEIGGEWHNWSNFLGLRENPCKDQFHHRTVKGRRALLAAGVSAERISPWPKILGVHLVPATRRKSKGAECQRLAAAAAAAAAAWTLLRVQCLPVALSVKVLVASMSGVSKAAFGWMCRLPTLVEIRRLDWKVALSCRVARQSDPSLRRILLGHHASLGFRTASDQVMALWRSVKHGDALPDHRSFWAKTVCKAMQRLGWSAIAGAAWTWRNDHDTVSLDVGDQHFVRSLARFSHVMRESWRRSLFAKWRGRDRRDSQVCRHSVYCERECADARRAALTNRNTFTVLSGAAYSWARRVRPDMDRTCPLCCSALGSWEHCAWQCPCNPPQCRRPASALHARLGRGNAQVLDHLCHTRLLLLPYLRALGTNPLPDEGRPDNG